jgi:hypothetical protein
LEPIAAFNRSIAARDISPSHHRKQGRMAMEARFGLDPIGIGKTDRCLHQFREVVHTALDPQPGELFA